MELCAQSRRHATRRPDLPPRMHGSVCGARFLSRLRFKSLTQKQLVEVCNFSTHLTLRNLRPAGSKARGIPRGTLFKFVSCPNYLFEILAWTIVVGMTWDPAGEFLLVVSEDAAHATAAALFWAIGSYTMGLWAVKKHRRYKKEFGTEYPRRKALIPFVF